jgi:hypothetical protein
MSCLLAGASPDLRFSTSRKPYIAGRLGMSVIEKSKAM